MYTDFQQRVILSLDKKISFFSCFDKTTAIAIGAQNVHVSASLGPLPSSAYFNIFSSFQTKRRKKKKSVLCIKEKMSKKGKITILTGFRVLTAPESCGQNTQHYIHG